MQTDPRAVSECPEGDKTNTNSRGNPEETPPENLLVIFEEENQGEYGERDETVFSQSHVQEDETLRPQAVENEVPANNYGGINEGAEKFEETAPLFE